MIAPRIVIPRISDHGSEIGLLGMMAAGTIALLWHALDRAPGGSGLDAAAFLLILQRIIEAITARWTQRSVDRMGQQLATSQPSPEGPTGGAGDPLFTRASE